MAPDMTRPPRLWLLGTPRRNRLRLHVLVQTQSKSIECSFNVHSIVLRQCRFNVVYSADMPLVAVEHSHRRDCMCGYVRTWYSESLRVIDMLAKEWKG